MTATIVMTAYLVTDSWSAQPWPLPGTHATPEAALTIAVAIVRAAVAGGDYDCDGDRPDGDVTVWLVEATDDAGKALEVDLSAHAETISFD